MTRSSRQGNCRNRGKGTYISDPLLHRLQRRVARQVEDNDGRDGVAVVQTQHIPKPFVAGDVPQLQRDAAMVQLLHTKIDADRDLIVFREVPRAVSLDQRRFAGGEVPDNDHFV